jgi:hypothetical protein
MDILSAAGSFIIFLILVIFLPDLIQSAGIAYLIAIIVFIISMSGAGYIIGEKIT